MLYIFDKDGTICRSKSGKKFINSVEDQELIPGVKKKIEELKAQGHKICIASNQGGVAFGYMTWADALSIMKHASDLIGADDYISCTAHPDATDVDLAYNSLERKPNPGMVFYLAFQTDVNDADDVLLIGDRPEDEECARRAGVKFEWAWDFFGRPNPNLD